jgi:tetratricopeptide (TPR) repeat protein
MLLPWTIGLAAAADPGCAPGIEDFRHEVTIVSSSRVETVDTARFAVPSGLCDAIVLPRALDGFTLVGSDLRVDGGRMTRKGQWAEGDVLVVERTGDLGPGPHSEEVLQPTFPVATMSVEVRAPSWMRLNAWSSPHGEVAVTSGRERAYTVTFEGGGRLVWSGERDWWAVGDRLARTTAGRLANKWSLGSLGEGLDALTVADAVQRVAEAIELTVEPGDWRSVRPTTTVIRAGSGTVAERALVLISLLRAAGHDADPVLVRPVDAAPIPLVVPSHAVFPGIAVRVRRADGETLWLDPASPYVEPDVVPRQLRGAVILAPDDQPRTLYDRMVPDGRVKVRATARLRDDGSVEVTADVTAADGATQAIRDLLAPLPKATRQQYLGDLLRVVRPGLDDLRLQVFGVEDPALPFGITLEFDTDAALRPLGAGRAGAFPAILAPQLARVLPPNLEVVETLVVEGTDALQLYGVRPVEDPVDADAIVNRFMAVDDNRATLSTLALRPWRASDRSLATERLLDEASLRGPELVYFGLIDKAAARALQKEVTNSDTRVMEALLWYQADEVEEAEKALKRAVRTGRIRAVADALRRYAPRGDQRPWQVVWQAVDTDLERLAIVEALEGRNAMREAWRRALVLVQSPDVAVQIEALLAVARVQGEKPAATVDREGHKAWREPTLLLARAEKLAAEAGDTDPAIDVAFAERLLERGLCEKAGPRIERAVERSRDPLADAVYEEWRTCAGREGEPADLPALIRSSGFDAGVMRSAVRTFQTRGEHDQARRWAVLAAMIEQTDADLWSMASEAALAVGDLDTAVYAARNASDIKPASLTTGIPLQILATLNADRTNAQVGTQRSNYQVSIEPFPIPLANAEEFMDESHRLGFLRERDAEVLEDAVLLAERFERNVAAGNTTDALRDAAWLVKRHRTPTAAIDFYRATAGQLWSTHALEQLDASVRDRDVRRLRMESALLTGIRDPMADANLLRGDPLAELLREARYRSGALADSQEWPKGLSRPKANAPAGFRPSRLLSALKGVEGYTNAAAGSVLLVSTAGDRLPPPLEGAFRLGPLVETDGKTSVFELEGGMVPGYVARRTLGENTFFGAARTAQLARHALASGLVAQSY